MLQLASTEPNSDTTKSERRVSSPITPLVMPLIIECALRLTRDQGFRHVLLARHMHRDRRSESDRIRMLLVRFENCGHLRRGKPGESDFCKYEPGKMD